MESKRFLKVLAMSILMFSLTVSASLAEMQTVTKEGVIKATRYGNGYLKDRPTQPWTLFGADEVEQ